MKKRGSILIQVFIVLVALAGSIYVAVAPANSLMNWYNIDDAFYYYKVALNIRNGLGSTFDGINVTNGYHPLWMLVCIGLAWITTDLNAYLYLVLVINLLFVLALSFIVFKIVQPRLGFALRPVTPFPG